jgi:transcription initiation factor TFIIB
MCSPQRGENKMNDSEKEGHKNFDPEPASQLEPAKVQRCPECGSTRLMRDHRCAEIVCMNCGFVIAAKIADRGPEWRAFTNEQRAKRARVGAPLTYTIHDKGLSTIIDWHDRDSRGKSLSYGQKAQMYRLRKWHRRIRVSDATERNLTFALSEMNKIGNNLNLPKNILETASVIYRKALKEQLIRGRSIQGVTAAAIYLACRQCKLARTLEEIAQASNMNKKEVGRNYRFLIKKLDYSIPPVKPSRYIAKFSNQLMMQGKAEEFAHKILAAAKELKLTSGRGPMGMAAAASYIASVLSGERRTQREVAEIAEVTEVTIRNRYKELVKRLMLQISL